MANGYAPDYSPYPHHPPPPPGLYDHTPSASASGSGSGPETRRPRLAPPVPGSFAHPGMSHPPPHQHQHPFGGPHGMSVQFPGNVAVGENEEDANRSRNARAQRRHREKRKAHVKNVSQVCQRLSLPSQHCSIAPCQNGNMVAVFPSRTDSSMTLLDFALTRLPSWKTRSSRSTASSTTPAGNWRITTAQTPVVCPHPIWPNCTTCGRRT